VTVPARYTRATGAQEAERLRAILEGRDWQPQGVERVRRDDGHMGWRKGSEIYPDGDPSMRLMEVAPQQRVGPAGLRSTPRRVAHRVWVVRSRLSARRARAAGSRKNLPRFSPAFFSRVFLPQSRRVGPAPPAAGRG
jgi:hypothetical protein